MVTCLLTLRYQCCLSFYECLCQVRGVSGHLSVKVRGIDVASLSTGACVK